MTDDAKRIPFTEEDERKIGSAARWGMIVSITSLVTASLTIVAELGAAGDLGVVVVSLLTTGLSALINVWLLQASLALRKVATTDVADHAYLLSGFRRLRTYFMAQVIFVLLVVGVAILRGIASDL